MIRQDNSLKKSIFPIIFCEVISIFAPIHQEAQHDQENLSAEQE